MRHGRGPYRLPPCHPSERTKPCHCSYRVAPHQSLSYFTPTLSRAPLHVITLIIGALLSSSSFPASHTRDVAAPRLAVAQGGEAASLKAAFLVEAWSEAYGLGGDSVLPPSAVPLPPGVPAAPHLEDCARVSAEREAWERRGALGEEPAWTRGAPRQADAAAAGDTSPGCSGQAQGEEVPQPPWIRGPDEASLPLTRVVQRDIWQNQFPPGDCTDRRLLVAHWAKSTSHGVGSQIHYLSALLSVAMRHNRTLVAQPDAFDRARTPSCEAGQQIFFPPFPRFPSSSAFPSSLPLPFSLWGDAFLASPCTVQLDAKLAALSGLQHKVGRDLLRCKLQLYHAEEQVVVLSLTTCSSARESCERVRHHLLLLVIRLQYAAQRVPLLHFLGTKCWPCWHGSMCACGVGSVTAVSGWWRAHSVHWWRAQAVRFIMRWPSAHLCHVTNQERHRAFGMLAANLVTRFLHTQSETLSSLSHSTTPAAAASSAPIPLNVPANATDWEAKRRRAADRLAALAGSSLSFHSDATGSATGGGDNVNGTDASLLLGVQEPYMPRPIVSLHVRGTDKFAEMGLTSLDSHIFHMNRLRHHGLDLSHVWLNTETQANVDRAVADHLSWSFFYSSNARQQEAVGGLREYEWAQSVAVSLASVLIAAQCDYFVGSLGSNWSRLMNELRSTNGRLGAGFIADNVEEW
ncbi:unnamed protein product [Closterium sp. Naga37s-1]|nr:unnamed protein product [Closterium sp. Naga37s-1]